MYCGPAIIIKMKALALIILTAQAATTTTTAAKTTKPTTVAKPTSLYTAQDYYTKITQPSQCYGNLGLDVYESFNATDMGYEVPEKGQLHPGWVICNQSTKSHSTYDLSEIYLCNNNEPNSWMIYPNEKEGILRE